MNNVEKFVTDHTQIRTQDVINMIAHKDKAVQTLNDVCETVITDALTIRNGTVGVGNCPKKERVADQKVAEFLTSNNYSHVKNHGDNLVRSMVSLVKQRELYVERKGKAGDPELQAMRDTQAYIIDAMVKKGWTGSQKPPFPESPSVSGNRAGRVSAQASMKGRSFSTPRVQ